MSSENIYLENLLSDNAMYQTTPDDKSPELKTLRSEKKLIEDILATKFEKSDFKLYNGGSYSKNTMVKVSYDFDILCFFYRNSKSAGTTIEDIYNNVANAFDSTDYQIEKKDTAIFLKKRVVVKDTYEYINIDIVPGRFVEDDADKKTDCNLHQKISDKEYLKTNTGKQIRHVRDSGLTDIIRLLKIWRHNISLNKELKTFILELIAIKICDDIEDKTDLFSLLKVFWILCSDKDKLSKLTIKDPGNENGNDLTSVTNQVKEYLFKASQKALQNINDGNLKLNFEPLNISTSKEDVKKNIEIIRTRFDKPSRPWRAF